MNRPLAILLTLTTLLLALNLSAQSSHVDTQKRVIEALKREIAEGEKSISTLRKSRSTTESKVQKLATQVEQRNRLLEAQRVQVDLLEKEIVMVDSCSISLTEKLTDEQEAYAQMVREAYRNYHHNNFLTYIFSSKDFSDVARRITNIRRVAQLREQRIASIDSLSLQVDSTRAILLDRKASLDSTINDISQQRSRLQQDIYSARESIKTMTAKEKRTLQENNLQQQKLSTALEELRRLSKGNSEGSSFSSSTSNLTLPVSGGRVKRYMDNMAEVVGSAGASVVAIYEGKVVDVKQNRITGKYDIYVAHGEYITSYAGLRSVCVAKNSSVKKNQTIGEVGASVDIISLESEYKIIFGIYPPSPSQKMKASDCFKK